jgi:hypothetical protein
MKTLQVPNALLFEKAKTYLSQGKSITLKVRGRSMRIFIEGDRDLAVIEPPTPHLVTKGAIALAEVSPDHYVLHRITKINNNKVTLQGDGNVNIVEHCSLENVIGIATTFYRKGRTTPDKITDYKWKIYSTIWVMLRPIRRYLLFIHRKLFI